MQKLYMGVLNFIYRHITCHINENVRIVLMIICLLFMDAVYFFDWTKVAFHNEVPERIIVFVIFLLTILSVNDELRPVRWNRLVYWPFIIFGVSMLAISFVHKTGLVILALEYIVFFPALYFVWINRGDIKKLFNMIALPIVVEGFINLIYCFILSAQAKAYIFVNRYAGNTDGPNQFGELGAVLLIAGLYLLIANSRNIAGCLLSSVGLGVGMSYIILSGSRTAMVSVMVCILAAMIFAIKLCVSGKDTVKERLVSTVITLVLSAGIMYIGLQLDDIYFNSLQKQEAAAASSELSSSVIFQTVSHSSGNDLTLSGAENMLTAADQSEEQSVENIWERFTFSKDPDALSSGRLTIWKWYIAHFTMWGNDDYWDPDNISEGQIYHLPAHNNFIEFTYRCGYLTGAIYLILSVIIGIEGLKLLFGKKHTEYCNILCIMCIGAFTIYAMLEWAVVLSMAIPYLYYLSLAPIMGSAISPSRDS